MAGKCKICHSPLKDRIEERLFRGETVEAIATWCKQKGFSISPPSVLRHKNNHFEPTKTDNPNTEKWQAEIDRGIKKAEVDYSAPLIDSTKLMREIEREIDDKDVFGAVIHERKVTQLLLEKIVQKQLVIVHELQEQYSAGTAGYPDAQIRGLKTLLDTINALPTYTDKNLIQRITTSSTTDFETKVQKSAIQTAKKAASKYKSWDCVLKDMDLPAPKTYLEECAKLTKPANNQEHDRDNWISEQISCWRQTIVKNMPVDYESEQEIISAFDSLCKEHNIYCEDYQKEFLQGLIDEYKTPTQCIDACDEDDMYDFLDKRLHQDPFFIQEYKDTPSGVSFADYE